MLTDRKSPASAMVNRNADCGHGAHRPPAAIATPSALAWAIELRVTSRPRTSTAPYHDWRSPTPRKPASPTCAGTPLAARSTATRIAASCPAQYESYLDATRQVCSATQATAHFAACGAGHDRLLMTDSYWLAVVRVGSYSRLPCREAGWWRMGRWVCTRRS